MGLNSSPRIFTRISKCLRKFLQSRPIPVHQYLDDWLAHGSSKEQAEYCTCIMLELMLSLGFLVNLAKSDLQPKQDFQFLSYHFMLAQGKATPTEDRWGKIQQKILAFLHNTNCTACA